MTKTLVMSTLLGVMLCGTACGNKYPIRTVYVYAEDTEYYSGVTMTGQQAVELIQAQSDSILNLTADAKAFIKAADYHHSRLRKQLEHCQR